MVVTSYCDGKGQMNGETEKKKKKRKRKRKEKVT